MPPPPPSINIPSTTTDIVFIDTLHVSTTIGPDCWGKTKAQPIHISVYLHLTSGFLRKSGESDDVVDSVHYGYLTKAISALVEKRGKESGFEGIDGLVKEVAEEGFKLGGENVEGVRVILEAPKLILLASNFKVDVTIHSGKGQDARLAAKAVTVEELTIPVIIGVNPPEREAKQRVVTDLVFYEKAGAGLSHAEYQRAVDKLSKEIESSSYLTLEKFVHEEARTACLSLGDSVEAVTVRARKPSALSFADYSGVEVTRRPSDFVRVCVSVEE
ncbi:hypothetical protein EST38_g9056 [Candolleomyces aberdarensis]|uniref:dihydroneopterin aldolase n=1 Tax=Candolleomyces aberdarensis TaxID=2316362 RepID=A0A4Q2DAX0_9AGAR|nr:hypothetical protein EST38_g9056 [Candolleomyces aberdarensis]